MRPALAAALLAITGAAAAQVAQDGFVVHYAAMRVSSLAPQMQRAVGVTPGPRRAMVLVNVQRGGKPVAATASGGARNLTGHRQPLALRPVGDDLIAEFEALDGEWLTFEITVLPAGAPRPIPLKFQQQFYPD